MRAGILLLATAAAIMLGACNTVTEMKGTTVVEPATSEKKTSSNGDYMSPELRAMVEKLKADVTSEPSTPDTARQRMTILYDWANAYSLAGGVIPTGLPWDAAVILAWKGGGEEA